MYVCMYIKMLYMYFSIIISLYRGFCKNTSLAQNFFVIAIEHFCMKNIAIKRFFQGTQLNICYIGLFVITKFVISKFHCIYIYSLSCPSVCPSVCHVQTTFRGHHKSYRQILHRHAVYVRK